MKGFRSAKVNYPLAFSFSFQKIKPNLEIWPFMKRTAFKDEGEFRIVYESETEHLRSKHVDIDLAAIRRVTLSPWLPQPVAESVTSIIRGIAGCSQLPVNHSELLDNAAWRKLIE